MPRSTSTKLPGLRAAVEASGYRFDFVAGQAGVQPQTLRALVSGHRGASLDLAHRLATFLGVSIESLLKAAESCPAK